jgi:hypothetical protein
MRIHRNISVIFFILAAIMFIGCGKKKPSIPKALKIGKVDLLPRIVNVRYNKGTSGVDSCKDCHKTVYEEWKGSFHAQSGVSESFYTETDKYKLKECMSCHVPSKIHLEAKRPVPRDWKPHEGVTCSACHVVENRIMGPYGSNAPHATRRVDAMSTSQACASCHKNTVEEWETSQYKKDGFQCQTCHMETVKRHISDRAKHLYKPKDAHRHEFKVTFDDVVDANVIVGKLMQNQIVVEVTNKGAGHSLPTGIYGDVNLFVELKVMDRDKTVFFREEKLSARLKNSIKPGETRRFFYNYRPKRKSSHLAMVKVYFTSSNYRDDIKLAEVKQYIYEDKQ